MQPTDIATEVPSPISALAPFRPKNPKRILILGLATAVCVSSAFGLGYFLWYNALRSHSKAEIMSEKISDLGYFYEPRAQLCFQIDLRHGTGAMVACDAVTLGLDPRLAWLADYTWYFQDLSTGMCYAMVRHPHLPQGSPAPVPCRHTPNFNRSSADGRWRYEHLPTSAP